MIILAAATSYWMLFYSLGATIWTAGPLTTRIDCDFVKHQVQAKMKPKVAECIEVPVFKQE